MNADRASLEQAKADYEINILSASSALAAARADVRNAEIDLGYCRIAAPIDGRINAREFDVGNYVGDGQSTVLATIVEDRPDLRLHHARARTTCSASRRWSREGGEPDDRTGPRSRWRWAWATRRATRTGAGSTTPTRAIDTGTGTVRVRGIFPNPGGVITPGLFVRTRVPFDRHENALLVPDRALGSDQGGPYLLVVGQGRQGRAPRSPSRHPGRRGCAWSRARSAPTIGSSSTGLLRARPGLKVAPKIESRPPGRRRRRRPTGVRTRLPEADRASPTMFSKFFIERPIFANVIAIITMLVGAVTLFGLPIEQYPQITPADGPGRDELPRGQRPGPLRHRRLADRAGGQRRRGDALHVLDLLAATARTP